jgi:cytochrome c553
LRGAALSPHTTRKLLARALLETRRPAEARDLLQIVLDQGPDPEASWLLSRALLQDGAIAEAMQSLRLAENSGQPQGPEPAPYVGAASCAECHAAIYRSQQESRHARTFRPAAQLQFLSLPDRPMADPVDSRVLHTFQRHGESIRVETRAGEHTFRAVIESAIGSGEPALTPLARDADGRAYELRLTLYAAGPAWDKSAGQPDNPEAPEGFLGRFLNHDAVRRCLECHTTSSYVAQEQLETPAKRDHGVSCERCHGPGGHHLLAVAADFPDLAISRPQVDQAESLVTMCGRCHSPKGSPISSEDPAHIRFQASTLIHSLCYTRSGGAFQCVTCHNPHADAERSPSFYEAKCLACHGVATAGPAEQSKRVPCPVNPATNCLPCHMPVATNVLPHTSFTDHHIRVRPDTDSD